MNDGDGHYKHKETMKQMFLDYMEEPRNSERRILERGIFTTYSFGDPKTHKTIRIIFLDV
jgi:alkaline phosphatase D